MESYSAPVKRCKLCSHRAASDSLDEILDAKRAGKTSVSVLATADFLSKTYGIPVSGTFVQFCVTHHRGGTWRSHSPSKGEAA